MALGVPSPQAAEFLLKQIRLKPESQDVLFARSITWRAMGAEGRLPSS